MLIICASTAVKLWISNRSAVLMLATNGANM